ncbi:HFR031Wp [Eremothecium sinecaudum]|uniref:Cytochrome c oxidase subunit 13, mitochondrial n=1 Tax=Eremothecium sinecaudum TaxID=45286 RepID=A0A109UXU8_9SACH|nr:HFR031Wp [Eremothecium sinecaudum]AMD21886.1 HFR031Wp [Eremothecium sinecaudum]
MFRLAIRKASTLPPHAFKNAFPAGGDKEAARAFKEHMVASAHHGEKTSKMWYKISLFVGLPAIMLAAVNTYFVEAEHAAHREHLKHIPDEEWPRDYSFQNMRQKPFFWGDGDKTLFWNPVINRHIQRN